jgi:hypothetical protein
MRHENDEKNDDIIIKLLVSSILYLTFIIIVGSKRILIFIALNRARTLMINHRHLKIYLNIFLYQPIS